MEGEDKFIDEHLKTFIEKYAHAVTMPLEAKGSQPPALPEKSITQDKAKKSLSPLNM